LNQTQKNQTKTTTYKGLPQLTKKEKKNERITESSFG